MYSAAYMAASSSLRAAASGLSHTSCGTWMLSFITPIISPRTVFSRLHWSVMRSFCAVCTAVPAALWEAAPEPAGAAGAAAPPQPVSSSAAARTTAAKHLCFMAVSFHLQSPGHTGGWAVPGAGKFPKINGGTFRPPPVRCSNPHRRCCAPTWQSSVGFLPPC